MKAYLVVFIVLFAFTFRAHAEYYIVYTPPTGTCAFVMTDMHCVEEPHYYKHKHKKHHPRSSGTSMMMQEYAWIPDPTDP